jgi:hypothetical protein
MQMEEDQRESNTGDEAEEHQKHRNMQEEMYKMLHARPMDMSANSYATLQPAQPTRVAASNKRNHNQMNAAPTPSASNQQYMEERWSQSGVHPMLQSYFAKKDNGLDTSDQWRVPEGVQKRTQQLNARLNQH